MPRTGIHGFSNSWIVVSVVVVVVVVVGSSSSGSCSSSSGSCCCCSGSGSGSSGGGGSSSRSRSSSSSSSSSKQVDYSVMLKLFMQTDIFRRSDLKLYLSLLLTCVLALLWGSFRKFVVSKVTSFSRFLSCSAVPLQIIYRLCCYTPFSGLNPLAYF